MTPPGCAEGRSAVVTAPSNQSQNTAPEGLARVVLEELADDHLVLSIPHTDYRIRVKPTVPTGEIDVTVGKRLKGVIQAHALKIHRATGGGRFIEPVWGEPRIVAGKILTIDAEQRRILVDVSVPVWITPPDGTDLSTMHEGELVNFYVQSGTRFRPVISAA